MLLGDMLSKLRISFASRQFENITDAVRMLDIIKYFLELLFISPTPLPPRESRMPTPSAGSCFRGCVWCQGLTYDIHAEPRHIRSSFVIMPFRSASLCLSTFSRLTVCATATALGASVKRPLGDVSMKGCPVSSTSALFIVLLLICPKTSHPGSGIHPLSKAE